MDHRAVQAVCEYIAALQGSIVENIDQEYLKEDIVSEVSSSAVMQVKAALERHAGRFLALWGTQLPDHLLSAFDAHQDSDVALTLREVRRQLDHDRNPKTIRNRRFVYMQAKLEGTEYFSEQSMKERSPALYQEFIGKYLTEQEVAIRARIFQQKSLSDQLMTQLGRHESRRTGEEEDDEDEDDEEGDGPNKSGSRQESDAEDGDHQYQKEHHRALELLEKAERGEELTATEQDAMRQELDRDTVMAEAAQHKTHKISQEEKENLIDDFASMMRERFLRGEDEDFNYACCDHDRDLDITSRHYQRDEEDAYFDDDAGYEDD